MHIGTSLQHYFLEGMWSRPADSAPDTPVAIVAPWRLAKSRGDGDETETLLLSGSDAVGAVAPAEPLCLFVLVLP